MSRQWGPLYKPVYESFAVLIYDDIELNDVYSFIKIFYSNTDGYFEGFLVGSDGKPIKDAFVAFTEVANITSEKLTLLTHTNDDGYYKYIGLRDGKYRVEVSASKYGLINCVLDTKRNVTLRKDYELDPIVIE